MNTKHREKTYRCRSFRVAIKLPTDRFAPQLRILYAAPPEYPMTHMKKSMMQYRYIRGIRVVFFKTLHFRLILSQVNSPSNEQEEGRVLHANSL